MEEPLSQFLLDLYRASREVPFANFQAWCLHELRKLIDFDAAWWGNASDSPLQMYRIHLFNCAPDIVDDYMPYMQGDRFREVACAQPGVTVNTSDLYSREALDAAPIRPFADKHKVAWSIGTVVIEELSSLYELMTLWRHDRARPFSEADRQRKQTLMPHMVEAHRNARLLQLRPRGNDAQVWALCNEQGFLQEVSPRFAQLLKQQWPTWHGGKLPDALEEFARAGGRFVGRQYSFEFVRTEHLRMIVAQPHTVAERLPRQQREVATRYAQGLTYQEIAAQLGTAPATVRSQIAAVFKKLGVANKAELVHRLRLHDE